MSLNKRIKGEYTIESIDSGDKIIMHQAGGITIAGDLTITGTATSVESIDTTISDNEIVLNFGESGPGVSLGTAGIEIDRGTLDNVGIRFNETSDSWEATDDGTTWYDLEQVSGLSFDLVDDVSPQLGADLDVNGFAITSLAGVDIELVAGVNGEVAIDPVIALRELSTELPISGTAGTNKVYAAPSGIGGSGVFTTTSTATDELVSKKKAIFFALIF